MAAPVVSDDAETSACQKQHLTVPSIRGQRPAVREHDRSAGPPILEEDPRPVFHRDHVGAVADARGRRRGLRSARQCHRQAAGGCQRAGRQPAGRQPPGQQVPSRRAVRHRKIMQHVVLPCGSYGRPRFISYTIESDNQSGLRPQRSREGSLVARLRCSALTLRLPEGSPRSRVDPNRADRAAGREVATRNRAPSRDRGP